MPACADDCLLNCVTADGLQHIPAYLLTLNQRKKQKYARNWKIQETTNDCQLNSITLDAFGQVQKNGFAQVCSGLQALAPRALTFSVVPYAIRQLSL